jgi:hypothetical protein
MPAGWRESGRPGMRLTVSANPGADTCRRLADRANPLPSLPSQAPLAPAHDEFRIVVSPNVAHGNTEQENQKNIVPLPCSVQPLRLAPSYRGSGTFGNHEPFVTQCTPSRTKKGRRRVEISGGRSPKVFAGFFPAVSKVIDRNSTKKGPASVNRRPLLCAISTYPEVSADSFPRFATTS